MPFYYVRLYQNDRGEKIEVLYVNVWYAATRMPSPEERMPEARDDRA